MSRTHSRVLKLPDTIVYVMTSVDGHPLRGSKKVLVTLCGRCENTGMAFTPDRRSVGRNRGKAPVQIEPVEGEFDVTMGWLVFKGKLTCHALKPDGTAGEEVPIILTAEKDGKAAKYTITLSAKYGTMWYLLERK